MRLSLWNSATDEQSLKMSLKYPALPFQQRLRTSAAQAWEAPESHWWNNTRRVSLRAPRQKQTLHGSITAWVGSWHGHKTRLRGTAYICNKYKIATVTSQSGWALERKKILLSIQKRWKDLSWQHSPPPKPKWTARPCSYEPDKSANFHRLVIIWKIACNYQVITDF